MTKSLLWTYQAQDQAGRGTGRCLVWPQPRGAWGCPPLWASGKWHVCWRWDSTVGPLDGQSSPSGSWSIPWSEQNKSRKMRTRRIQPKKDETEINKSLAIVSYLCNVNITTMMFALWMTNVCNLNWSILPLLGGIQMKQSLKVNTLSCAFVIFPLTLKLAGCKSRFRMENFK